jgi:hypothetical protein
MESSDIEVAAPASLFEASLLGSNPEHSMHPVSLGVSNMPRASKSASDATLGRLQTELVRLKQKFKMGQELKPQWMPNNDPKSGEVTGGTIRIYEEDEATALETLRHEFIEYLLTRDLVAPYKRLINKLISLFEEEMYDRKEKLVERLQELAK